MVHIMTKDWLYNREMFVNKYDFDTSAEYDRTLYFKTISLATTKF